MSCYGTRVIRELRVVRYFIFVCFGFLFVSLDYYSIVGRVKAFWFGKRIFLGRC